LEVVRKQLVGTGDFGRYGLGSVRTSHQFAAALGVDFAMGVLQQSSETPKLWDGVQFVEDSTEYAAESVEEKIQSLDTNAKNLIAAFLSQQMN